MSAGDPPGVRPRLANLAVKVDDLDAAIAMLESLPGARCLAVHELAGDSFAEAQVGEVVVNLFESAIYESAAAPLPSGFLHTSHFVERLDPALEDPAWAAKLIWGPAEISGGFGTRRIAFFEPLPGLRVELMEEVTR